MNVERFEQWLHDKLGFSAEIIGHRAIEFAVRQRLDALGLEDEKEYFGLLTGTTEEWQKLVNLITIPETWFFRDEKPFVFLAGLAQRFCDENVGEQVLRILSVPCSSGEEPYSIVMALLDQGLPQERFRVDAIDVNTTVLDRARQGIYRESALRAIDDSTRERHFERSDDHFVIRDYLRNQVNFKQGNILQLSDQAVEYDVIFCRNLLIYLSESKKQLLLRNLERALHENGVLILGHAELTHAVLARFTPVGVPGSFAVRRRDVSNANSSATLNGVPSLETPASTTPASTPVLSVPRLPVGRDARAATIQREEIERLVTKVEKLADSGYLDEAARYCLPFVDASIDDPDLYYVCGLVYEALGRWSQAIDLLRRAVVLQPEHYRALVHLAMALEAHGQVDEASELRRAAETLAERD